MMLPADSPIHPIDVTILGATGSIGTQALNVIAQMPERYRVHTLVAGQDADALAALAIQHQAQAAVIVEEVAYIQLKNALSGTAITPMAGYDAMLHAARTKVGRVVSGISGTAGIAPTLAAIEAGQVVALANKETLVAAGALVQQAAKHSGAVILPVDSEHYGVFTLLRGVLEGTLSRVMLTASGGALRDLPLEALPYVTKDQALAHPTWQMGAKITIDSATLMNKGLELIEAQILFNLLPEQLEAVIHPQSVIHAVVETHDGGMLAQMSTPDMRLPISACLAWPDLPAIALPRLNLAEIGRLDFSAPCLKRYPALGLAYQAMRVGGAAPLVLNAANEVAVHAFLAGYIGFCDIVPLCEQALQTLPSAPSSLAEVVEIDYSTRMKLGVQFSLT